VQTAACGYADTYVKIRQKIREKEQSWWRGEVKCTTAEANAGQRQFDLKANKKII